MRNLLVVLFIALMSHASPVAAQAWNGVGAWPMDTVLNIGPAGYTRLLSTIERRGVNLGPTYNNGSQLIYRDKENNRHAMIIIRKPDGLKRMHSLQISVWVNGRDAKPGKKFFFYNIQSSGHVMYDKETIKDPGGANKNAVREAVQTVLAMK